MRTGRSALTSLTSECLSAWGPAALAALLAHDRDSCLCLTHAKSKTRPCTSRVTCKLQRKIEALRSDGRAGPLARSDRTPSGLHLVPPKTSTPACPPKMREWNAIADGVRSPPQRLRIPPKASVRSTPRIISSCSRILIFACSIPQTSRTSQRNSPTGVSSSKGPSARCRHKHSLLNVSHGPELP